MDQDDILQSFEKLLTDLSIELRYEKGNFRGGFCRYRDRKQIIINKDLNLNQKIDIMATELKSNFDLESLYLVPAVREAISDAGRME